MEQVFQVCLSALLHLTSEQDLLGLMRQSNIESRLVSSCEIRFRALMKTYKPGDIPIRTFLPSREWSFFSALVLDQKAAAVVLNFFYGLRNCFFHGAIDETFDKGGAMFKVMEWLDQGAPGLGCRRHRDNDTAQFWSQVARDWFKAYLIGAYYFHRSKDTLELPIGYSVLANMRTFLNTYRSATFSAAGRFFEVLVS